MMTSETRPKPFGVLLQRILRAMSSKKLRSVPYSLLRRAKRDGVTKTPLLSDFNLHFKDGKLVYINTGNGFEFNVGSASQNQRRYDQLGVAVDHHIYKLLQEKVGLKKTALLAEPGSQHGSPKGFFFQSEDLESNAKGLLVLIHGSGVVKAGQWSRRLVINNSLESGTQLPYIEDARKEGWAVVVMNTNHNKDDVGRPIAGSETPERHAYSVWVNAVQKSPAKHVGIVAHSYGGCITVSLLDRFADDFEKRVCAIALTDSVHSMLPFHLDMKSQLYFRKVAQNWAQSKKRLDEVIDDSPMSGCRTVSAGTMVHEETSWKSITSVLWFIREKFSASQAVLQSPGREEPEEERTMNKEEKGKNMHQEEEEKEEKGTSAK